MEFRFLGKSISLEDKWDDVIKKDLDEETKEQQSAIWKFIKTEQKYLYHLSITNKLFLRLFRLLKNEGQLQGVEEYDIFINIPEIYQVHVRLLEDFLLPSLNDIREGKTFNRQRIIDK